MKYKINESACGAGKTTSSLQLIKHKPTYYFLVIVPSIDSTNLYTGKIIDSAHYPNVQDAILNAVNDSERVIIITHKAFIDCTFKQRLCDNRIVIQDEQLTVFNTRTINDRNHPNLFDQITNEKSWYEIKLSENAIQLMNNYDDFQDVRLLKDIHYTQSRIWTNDLEPLDNNDLIKTRLVLQVINSNCYAGAKEVIITCANFTNTLQYKLWSNIFKQEFEVTHKFQKYNTPNLTVHHAAQETNSITYNKQDDHIRKEVINYIGDNETIYVDNNFFKDIQQDDFTRLSSNCAGLNDFKDKNKVAFLSALNYDLKVQSFLQTIGELTKEETANILTGEILHQVAMRCSLRVNLTNKCDIYVMSKILAEYAVNNLFENATTKEIPNTNRLKKQTVAKPKKQKLSQSDKNKASMIRKNFSEFKDYKTKDLMSHKIWENTNSRGILKVLSRR